MGVAGLGAQLPLTGVKPTAEQYDLHRGTAVRAGKDLSSLRDVVVGFCTDPAAPFVLSRQILPCSALRASVRARA